MSAHEDEFREALNKYMNADHPNENRHLVHWVVITNSVSLTDSDADLVGVLTDESLAFSHEMGLIDYVQTILRGRVVREDD